MNHRRTSIANAMVQLSQRWLAINQAIEPNLLLVLWFKFKTQIQIPESSKQTSIDRGMRLKKWVISKSIELSWAFI